MQLTHTTQTFTEIQPVAQQDLIDAGYHPVYHEGKFHVTAPWTWHRHGNGWQFMLPVSEAHPTGLHFFEDENGVLHHD